MISPSIPLSPEVLSQASEMLKTLGHPVRLKIIEALENGEQSVGEIQAAVSQPQAATSLQLKQLRLQGLVAARRAGTSVYYRISDEFVVKVLDCVRQCALEGRL